MWPDGGSLSVGGEGCVLTDWEESGTGGPVPTEGEEYEGENIHILGRAYVCMYVCMYPHKLHTFILFIFTNIFFL